MNKSNRITRLCCLCLPLLAQAQTLQVDIAGTAYPVAFEDAALSVTNRQRIASDLTTVFSISPSFEELKGYADNPGVFRLRDDSMFFDNESDHVFLVDKNNQKSLLIEKPLSDKYQQTFAFLEAHSNAVQKAHEFVALLNSTNLLEQSAVQVLSQICHFAPKADTGVPLDLENLSNDEIEQIEETAADYLSWKYYGFSVLRFYVKPAPRFGNVEVPCIIIFMTDKSDPSKNFAAPIGFLNGRWGFGILPYPD